MIAKLRLAVFATTLALPMLALAADPPPASTASNQPAVAPAAQAASTPTAAGSASTATDAPPAPAASSGTAATAPPATPGKIAPPPAGKGQVVFFRESRFTGAMMSFMVREGTNELGKLGNGNYFVATLAPGAHDFAVHTENKDTLHMEIEDGETYYVMGSISMGFMAGHANIAPSDEAVFDKDFDKLKKSN
jgi:hypothetical protein